MYVYYCVYVLWNIIVFMQVYIYIYSIARAHKNGPGGRGGGGGGGEERVTLIGACSACRQNF